MKAAVSIANSKYDIETDSELVARANAEKDPGRGVQRASN